MSNDARRTPQHSVESHHVMMSKAEQELAQGFVEVEITGLSFRRLLSIYSVLVRHAWLHATGSVRSLLRVDAAHQA